MPILKHLAESPDKATLDDFLIAIDKLDVDAKAIPQCMNNADGSLNLKNFAVLTWIPAMREKPEITLEEVQKMIPITDIEKQLDLIYEVIYFWTPATREKLDELHQLELQSRQQATEKADTDENPTEPIPESLIPSESKLNS